VLRDFLVESNFSLKEKQLTRNGSDIDSFCHNQKIHKGLNITMSSFYASDHVHSKKITRQLKPTH
jgi:hypothetical protein